MSGRLVDRKAQCLRPALTIGGGPVDAYRRAHRSPASERASTVRPNFSLRRLVAVGVLVVVTMTAVALVDGALASLGGAPAAAAEASPSSFDVDRSTAGVAYHVARPGDSIWSIADEHRGSVGHGRYVDALIRLNGGTAIEVGQAVWLP